VILKLFAKRVINNRCIVIVFFLSLQEMCAELNLFYPFTRL